MPVLDLFSSRRCASIEYKRPFLRSASIAALTALVDSAAISVAVTLARRDRFSIPMSGVLARYGVPTAGVGAWLLVLTRKGAAVTS